MTTLLSSLDYVDLAVVGSTNRKELELLYGLASEVKENGIIVDIGTCEGRSAFALALGSKPSVKVYTIDPTPNKRFYEHRKHLGLDDRLVCIEKKSQDVVWNREFDLMFDDGLHEYWGVFQDIQKFCPHLIKDSTCAFHDFTLYDNTVGKAILDNEGKFYKQVGVIGNIYLGKKI